MLPPSLWLSEKSILKKKKKCCFCSMFLNFVFLHFLFVCLLTNLCLGKGTIPGSLNTALPWARNNRNITFFTNGQDTDSFCSCDIELMVSYFLQQRSLLTVLKSNTWRLPHKLSPWKERNLRFLNCILSAVCRNLPWFEELSIEQLHNLRTEQLLQIYQCISWLGLFQRFYSLHPQSITKTKVEDTHLCIIHLP